MENCYRINQIQMSRRIYAFKFFIEIEWITQDNFPEWNIIACNF